MERDNDLIDLGAASEETRGPNGWLFVDEIQMRNDPGLSDR